MEQFRNRVRHHDEAAGWLKGRRAWSAVRTAAVLNSDSVVRRTMRENRAQAASEVDAAPTPTPSPTPTPAPGLAAAHVHPEVSRLRAKLRSGDRAQVERGAQLLLELTEPESLEAARLRAFSDATAAPEAEAAVAKAWERFRHDRHRALN